MKTFHFLISLVLLLFMPFSMLMADSVGTLEMKRGVVKIRRNQVDTFYREIGVKVPVNNGDVIQTGNNTRVIIADSRDRPRAM